VDELAVAVIGDVENIKVFSQSGYALGIAPKARQQAIRIAAAFPEDGLEPKRHGRADQLSLHAALPLQRRRDRFGHQVHTGPAFLKVIRNDGYAQGSHFM
jgi:hypothetical protein